MTVNDAWLLLLSVEPGETRVRVKIIRGISLCKEGEQLQLLGEFSSKALAEETRKSWGDEELVSKWGTRFLVTNLSADVD